ncbi:MAG: hypothetical protein ACFCGT_10185 [Sandaracinaceae bacterium]
MTAIGRHERVVILALATMASACGTAESPRLPVVEDPVRDAGVPVCGAPPDTVRPTAPCGCDDDCAGQAVCLPELVAGVPGGQCLSICDPGLDPAPQCGPDARCLAGPGGPGICVLSCATRGDCPTDEPCAGGICQRLCVEDRECASGRCDRYAGFCVAEPLNPDGAGLLAPCLRSDDCRSLACVDFSPGRHCLSECDTARPGTCPDGAACVAGSPGDELGLCAPRCDEVTEACPEPGLRCASAVGPVPGLRVCLPE